MTKNFINSVCAKIGRPTVLWLVVPIVLATPILLYSRPYLPVPEQRSTASPSRQPPSIPSLSSSVKAQPQFWPPPHDGPPQSKLSERQRWNGEKTAPICRQIIENVALHNACERDPSGGGEKCRNLTNVPMFSQYSQDRYIYSSHFSRLKRRGIYLDVAANHPTSLSNTYFVDECLGWDGICVEANPEYHGKLKKARSCRLVPSCVSDEEGQEVEFLAAGGRGGIKETNKFYSSGDLGARSKLLKLKCTTLARVLKELNVTVLDYLSLDVEGHELTVLKGIDWKYTRVNVMTVETSAKTLFDIEKFLVPHGYVRHMPVRNGKRTSLLVEDAIFLHESVTWGEAL